MEHLDFSYVLSSTLTPITLISGVGLLLMTMSARYAHTTDRLRQLLKALEMTADPGKHLGASIKLLFQRATLLRKAILLVVLSAACSGLLVLTCTVEAMFGNQLETLKHLFLLCSVGLIVVSTFYFALEVNISLKALEITLPHDEQTTN